MSEKAKPETYNLFLLNDAEKNRRDAIAAWEKHLADGEARAAEGKRLADEMLADGKRIADCVEKTLAKNPDHWNKLEHCYRR